MVYGRTFVLQMDHRPLLSIYSSNKGNPKYTVNQLQCWGTLLLDYDFKMEYIPLKELEHVNGLSKLIPKFNKPIKDIVIALLRSENKIKNVLFNSVSELPVTLDNIRFEA